MGLGKTFTMIALAVASLEAEASAKDTHRDDDEKENRAWLDAKEREFAKNFDSSFF